MTNTKTLFLSHASNDKADYVLPFADRLNQAGIGYWLDREDISWGDKLSHSINKGLSQSDYVVVFLSENFEGRNWTEAELSAALTRENSEGRTLVLPIVIGEPDVVLASYPLLQDKKYHHWNEGLDVLVTAVQTVMNQSSISSLSTGLAKNANQESEQHQFDPNRQTKAIQWHRQDCEQLGLSDDGTSPPKGLLGEFLLRGSDDSGWYGEMLRGEYCLSNPNNPNAVKYFYAGISSTAEQLSVDVKAVAVGASNRYSGAGLLLRFNPQSKCYVALMLNSSYSVCLYKRNQSGFSQIWSGQSAELKAEGWQTLAVHVHGERYTVYLNQEVLGSVVDRELTEGYSGLIAMGAGEFSFERFSSYKLSVE